MQAQSEGSTRFTALQLELLQTYSFEPTEEELLEVKHMLGVYFFNRLRNRMADRADELGVTDNDLDNWLEEAS